MKSIMDKSFRCNPEIMTVLINSDGIAFTHEMDNGIWKDKFPELLILLRSEYLAEQVG